MRRNNMIYEEKLKKVCYDFSMLNEGQQDYILGIMQALLFAKSAKSQTSPEDSNTGSNIE